MTAPFALAGRPGSLRRVPLRRRRGGSSRRRQERGHALITALFVLLLVSLAVALVAAALDSAMRGVRHELRSLELTALTDAALAEALAHLAQSPVFAGQSDHPYGGGVLGSEVRQMGSKRWRVEAWARHRGLVRRVRVEVLETVDGFAISGWRRVGTTL